MPISISFSSYSLNLAEALVWTESVEDEESSGDVEEFDEDAEDDVLYEADEDLEDIEEEDEPPTFTVIRQSRLCPLSCSVIHHIDPIKRSPYTSTSAGTYIKFRLIFIFI